MRHYDRAGFRHLNDGERYRDYEYVADDGWSGTFEQRAAPPGASATSAEDDEDAMRAPVSRGWVDAFVDAVFHPKQAVQRWVVGVFRSLGIHPPKKR